MKFNFFKYLLLASTSIFTGVGSLQAAVVINLTGAQVFESNGVTPVADSRLMYAIALPSSTFELITTSGWTSGDNIQIGLLWLTDNNVEIGGFSAALNFSLTGGVQAGQRFGMVWFPTISTQTGTPAGGLSYGFYSAPTWLIPADGNTENFAFETVSVGGTIPNSLGAANQSVVPEPTTWALLAGTLTTVMIFRRRRQA